MREAVGHAGIVDRGHDRAATDLQVADQPLDSLPLTRVEVAEGVVENEHVGRVHERPADEQELRLPGGEPVDRGVAPAAQAGEGECPVQRLGEAAATETGRPGEERQELVSPHGRPRGKLRRRVTDTGPHGIGVATD